MVGQVQGEIDVLMHLILLIAAGLRRMASQAERRSGHVRAEEEVVLVFGQPQHSWRILSSALRPKRRSGMS